MTIISNYSTHNFVGEAVQLVLQPIGVGWRFLVQSSVLAEPPKEVHSRRSQGHQRFKKPLGGAVARRALGLFGCVSTGGPFARTVAILAPRTAVSGGFAFRLGPRLVLTAAPFDREVVVLVDLAYLGRGSTARHPSTWILPRIRMNTEFESTTLAAWELFKMVGRALVSSKQASSTSVLWRGSFYPTKGWPHLQLTVTQERAFSRVAATQLLLSSFHWKSFELLQGPKLSVFVKAEKFVSTLRSQQQWSHSPFKVLCSFLKSLLFIPLIWPKRIKLHGSSS